MSPSDFTAREIWQEFLQTSGLLIPGAPTELTFTDPVRVEVAVACAPYGFGWPEIAAQLKMSITDAGNLLTNSRDDMLKLAKAVHAILRETNQLDGETAKPPANLLHATRLQEHARRTCLMDFSPSLKARGYEFGNLEKLNLDDMLHGSQGRTHIPKARVEGPYNLRPAQPTSAQAVKTPPSTPQTEAEAAKLLRARAAREAADTQWAAAKQRASDLNRAEMMERAARRRDKEKKGNAPDDPKSR